MLYTTYGHLFPNHDDDLVGSLDATWARVPAAHVLHGVER
jgi:hypothetical protein